MRWLLGKTRGGDNIESGADTGDSAPVQDVPALAEYVAESLGWGWQIVGVITDPQGPIIVFREPATGRTQPICLTQPPDPWSVRAEIEREIRKAMLSRGAPISGRHQ